MRDTLPNGSAQIIPDAAISDLSQEAIVLARKQYIEKNKKTEAEILSRDDIAFLNKAKIAIRGKITRSAISRNQTGVGLRTEKKTHCSINAFFFGARLRK